MVKLNKLVCSVVLLTVKFQKVWRPVSNVRVFLFFVFVFVFVFLFLFLCFVLFVCLFVFVFVVVVVVFRIYGGNRLKGTHI